MVLAYLNQKEAVNQSGLAQLPDVEPIVLGRIVPSEAPAHLLLQ